MKMVVVGLAMSLVVVVRWLMRRRRRCRKEEEEEGEEGMVPQPGRTVGTGRTPAPAHTTVEWMQVETVLTLIMVAAAKVGAAAAVVLLIRITSRWSLPFQISSVRTLPRPISKTASELAFGAQEMKKERMVGTERGALKTGAGREEWGGRAVSGEGRM